MIQGLRTVIHPAAVRDPFGNLLGILENPHFKPHGMR